MHNSSINPTAKSPAAMLMRAAPMVGSGAAQRALEASTAKAAPAPTADELKLRESFDTFVGESFYGQLLGSMRKTVGKPAYFHGGQAEETFRGQLDQMLASEMTRASAADFTGPMFELFTLNRS